MTVGATFYVGNTVTAQNRTASQKSVQTNMSKDEGINLSYMDTNVRPQDDFYNYVNGGWMKTAVIPSDKPSWGSFNALREDVDVASLDILNKILSENLHPIRKAKKSRHCTELS
jgi:putative endopeptidase